MLKTITKELKLAFLDQWPIIRAVLLIFALFIMGLWATIQEAHGQTRPVVYGVYDIKPGITLDELRKRHPNSRLIRENQYDKPDGWQYYRLGNSAVIDGMIAIYTLKVENVDYVARVIWAPEQPIVYSLFEERHGKPDSCEINDSYAYFCYWDKLGIDVKLNEAKTRVTYVFYSFPIKQ